MSAVYDELKLFEYVSSFSKEDINIISRGREFSFKQIKKVRISPSFFRKDECFSCGKCCGNFMINFTDEWVRRMNESKKEDFTKWGLDDNIKEEILNELINTNITINNNNINMYYLSKNKGLDGPRKENCRYLLKKEDKWYCKMHPVKSITCILPHIVVRVRDDITYLRKQQFGRNFLLGCPTKFDEFDYKKFKENDLPSLNILYDISKDMKIDSYLPDILFYFEKTDKDLKNGKIPKDFIDFEINKKGIFY